MIKIGDIIPLHWIPTEYGKTLGYVEEFEDGDTRLVIPQDRDELKEEGNYRVEAIDFDFDFPIRDPIDWHFTGGTTHGMCAKLAYIA